MTFDLISAQLRQPAIGVALLACGAFAISWSSLAQVNPGQAASGPPVIAGWAVILETGLARSYKNITGNGRVRTGYYQISFNRDISKCSYGVTPLGSVRNAFAHPLSGKPRTLQVRLINPANFQYSDAGFNLQVFC